MLVVVPWDQKEGGVASVVGNLARQLDRRRHRVTFLMPGYVTRMRKKETKWGFPGYEVKLRGLTGGRLRSLVGFLVFLPVTMYRLARLVHDLKIDVINLHYPLSNFFYFALISRFLGPPLVVSIHGADIFPRGHRQVRYPWGLLLLLFFAKRIVAPSRSLLHDFATVFPKLADRGEVIHNGLDISELAGPSDWSVAADSARSVLCIAAHNEKKGIDVLLRAFARVLEKQPDLTLTLVGVGPLRTKHEELARDLGLDGNVVFQGWKSRAEVGALLRRCDLFVLPSRSEPFGIVIIEAMACGKPVVASAVGGIPEIIQQGENGILVEPENPAALADAIIRVLEDEGLRTKIGSNGVETVRKSFRCEHNGARYERLFEAMLGNW